MSTKIVIKSITDSDEKAQITADVMESFFDWNPSRSQIENRALMHMNMPFFAALDGDRPIGFCALKVHDERTADIYTIGVFREYQRMGIGSSLVETAELYGRGYGFDYLVINTPQWQDKKKLRESIEAFFVKNGFGIRKLSADRKDYDQTGAFLTKYIGAPKSVKSV